MVGAHQVDLLDHLVVDVVTVVTQRNGCRLIHFLDIECVVGFHRGFVATFWARHPLNQLEGFQALHLIPDCACVPIDLLGDRFAFDGALALSIEVDEFLEHCLLALSQLDR